uniref:Uncharacterized protein n=1 Tax=Euplotes harpa TaxID=151035 RepID=A0A7S3N9I0_9SPIT|mmetsp:Transcript_26118/g.30161  ORF Transcript_26118/g.30161 Transcript_26118/m.30161 type:complete len:157 (+) Transcript_26118:914-1384(+)
MMKSNMTYTDINLTRVQKWMKVTLMPTQIQIQSSVAFSFTLKNKSQIHPKFLQKLNTLNSYSASSDINLSDQLEAEFLLKTLKPISRHKLIQAPDKPAKSGKAEKTQKPFAYSSPQEEGVSSNQKNMEFTFGKRKAENKVFKKVYRVSVPLDFEKA